MVNINLHQAAEQDLKIKKKKSIFKSGVFLSFSLLFVVELIFGGVVLTQKYLETKKEKTVRLKEESLASLNVDEVGELIGFKESINHISFNLDNKKNPEDVLKSVEGLMVDGTHLEELDYDDVAGKLKMVVVANSFRLAANQMLSLKKSDLFGKVIITDSQRNETGQAVFTLEATYKDSDGDNSK